MSKILSTGGTLGEIFAANAHRSYFMSFAYFYLHHALDKNSHVEVLYDYSYGKINAEKSPWVKKTKKTDPKKNDRATLRGPVFPLACGFIRRDNL